MINKIHKTKTIFAVFIMVILIITTRGNTNWQSSIIHLPDFVIPALFIAGVYLRTFWTVIVIIISAVAIDNYAIIHKGVSANCITPAYSILLLTYYGIFWVGKYLTTLKIDHNIIKNTLIIIFACITQWFIATASYFAFTTSFWGKFGLYITHWSIIEIPLILYWMIAICSIFTLNHRYLIITPFSTRKD